MRSLLGLINAGMAVLTASLLSSYSVWLHRCPPSSRCSAATAVTNLPLDVRVRASSPQLWLNTRPRSARLWRTQLGMQNFPPDSLKERGQPSTRVQSFLLSALKQRTCVLYERALGELRTELQEQGCSWESWSERERDYWLADLFVGLLEDGRPRSHCLYMLAAVHKCDPGCRFRTASAVLSTHLTLQLAKQAPACPPPLAYAASAWLLAAGAWGVGLAVALCASGLLRISEALNLRTSHLVSDGATLVLLLPSTKRGIEERVPLSHPGVVRLILRAARLAADEHGRVCSCSYGQVRRWLPRAFAALGFADVAFTSHSFRRGSASSLFASGVDMPSIAVMGRWASESSCREYIRRGEYSLLMLRKAHAPATWSRVMQLNTLLWGFASHDSLWNKGD